MRRWVRGGWLSLISLRHLLIMLYTVFQVKALDPKSLTAYSNAFLVQSAASLAQSATRADAMLLATDLDLQRLDALVSILEAKVLHVAIL